MAMNCAILLDKASELVLHVCLLPVVLVQRQHHWTPLGPSVGACLAVDGRVAQLGLRKLVWLLI
jgi:hypothetical protein